ncbi:hypothetical protein MF672_010910 [Actinomadura sp. ATCC 31491]|uniref:Virion structural protein n=1 Tax=Actinomadura luzonensis TaxID=2805427 RepID=A0ABT0FPR1_9ACTN|nr:hypothetical protein [Actinomadura luzonensis]MCK2214297.1 hypothetical protein [Actinomadura luzonensis]
MPLYMAANGAMATTAELSPVTTGTAIKTLLQIATPSTRGIRVVEWGISFDGAAAATPIRCELIDTNVAATVTAHVAAGVQPYSDPGATASLMTLGTSATGYTATAEGSITATRTGDVQLIAPTTQYIKQWPLGREFAVAASRFLRVRVKAGAAVNAYCYVIWEE